MKNTINKIIETQTIDEFSIEQQKEICEKYSLYNVEGDWYSDFLDEYKETMPKYFEDVEIYFSGFHSQGDGACFDAKINFNELIKAIPKVTLHGKTKNAIIKYNNDFGVDYEANISKYTTRYCHEKTRYFHFAIYSNRDNKKFIDKLINIQDEINGYFEQLRLDISKDIYSKLQKEYEERTSFKELKEYFEANETFFNVETLDME